MFSIELKQLKFFSFHGLYHEERRVGNEFIVDMEVVYEPGIEMPVSIEQTINYEELYKLVKSEMDEPKDLLETLAVSISQRVKERFPVISEVNISIKKTNPLIINFSGSVSVSYRKQFILS